MFRKLTSLLSDLGNDDSSTEKQPREQLVQLAAVALLIELSRADQQVDAVETNTILSLAKTQFNLSETDAQALMADATEKNSKAISLYEFTDLINQAFNKKEKVQLIENMWLVAYADGQIDRYEDHLIRKVADLIYVSHSDFIRVKHSAASTIEQ